MMDSMIRAKQNIEQLLIQSRLFILFTEWDGIYVEKLLWDCIKEYQNLNTEMLVQPELSFNMCIGWWVAGGHNGL